MIILVSIFLITLVSAETQTLGTFEQNSCINLIQTCSNCTYVNISSVLYPNSTQVIGEVAMSKVGTLYNYSFCNTSIMGSYIISGHGNIDGVDTTWNYNLIIAPAYSLNTATAIFYVGVVLLLCFLFIVCIGAIKMLPDQDPRDEEGHIMSINSLKYLRYPFGALAWGILVIISFVIFNFAEGYLTEGLLLAIFKMFFTLLMISATIGIPVILWFMFAKFLQDQVIKKHIERGIQL